jgi:hypothetical protein
MAIRKSIAATLLALALGACAELTAERPLFTVADQGAPPLQEGVWISIGDGCPDYMQRRRRFPSECLPLDIRRQDDGAWRVAVRVDLVSGLTTRERAEAEEDEDNGPYHVILAPAVERELGDGFYAPIYLAEAAMLSAEGSSVSYAIIAPIGAMPATEMHMAVMINCDDILREGPIDGVTNRYETRTDAEGQSYQGLAGCTASNPAAVREAVRRAVIEDLGSLTERRFVFVRAN